MSLSDYIPYISLFYGRIRSYGQQLGDSLYNAGTYLRDNDLDRAGQALQACHTKFNYFSNNCATYDTISLEYIMVEALQWIDDNWPEAEEYELTMHKIIDAMYEANAIEYHYFIGYIDAYRANMWNLPFYAEWHTFLTKHFS